jgi:hypothetical protein
MGQDMRSALFYWAALAVCVSLLCACPRQEQSHEPFAPRQRAQPARQPERPTAHFLFVIPPPDPLYPEREYFTSEFSAAAQNVFATAGWEYREVRLYEHPMNEWHAVMKKELNHYPLVVFSYHKVYMPLFCELATRIEIRDVSYVLALTPVKSGASSLINALEFRTEELGFLAGAALAGVTVSSHLAAVCFDDEIGERFTSGLYQGMTEQRSGATLSAIVVSRSDLIDRDDSVDLLTSRLEKENHRLSSGMSIDSLAFFTGPLAKPFITSLPARSANATFGPVPEYDIQTGVLLTSTYIDFGGIPQFIVENADGLGLLKPVSPVSDDDEVLSHYQVDVGGTLRSRGVQYIPVGLADGVLNYSGFSHSKRFRALPEGLASDIDYYYRAICAGEIEVSAELPK